MCNNAISSIITFSTNNYYSFRKWILYFFTKKLCDTGADMASQDSAGETPMHYAAKSGFPAIVKYLLEKGAPADLANSGGQTPKQCAVNAATKAAFPEDE